MSEDFFDKADAEISAAKEANEAWDNAVDWSPDKDKKHPATLRGVMLDVRWVNTKYGPAYLLLVKDYDDPELYWKVWGSRTVLFRELEQAAPARNSKIVIEWTGLQQARNDSSIEYHGYVVRAESFDRDLWDTLFQPEHQGVPEVRSADANYGPEEAPF